MKQNEEIEKIYNNYSKQIYNFIYGMSHNKDVSEEILQETFYIAIKNIEKFRGECKVNVWLCQIAKRLFYKYAKLNNNNISFENVTNIETQFNAIEDKDWDKEYLYNKILKLDLLSKQIVILRIYSELTFKEIAQILGKTETYVRVNFYRIKEKMKEDINNEKKTTM